MKWAKYILMAAAALAVLAVVAWGFMPKPVPVDTAAVSRGHLAVTIDEEGRTRVRDRFVVYAPLPGQMTRVELREGDPVDAGLVVTRLAPMAPVPLDARARAQAEANVRAAQAARDQSAKQAESARASLEYAENRVKNLRELLKGKHVPQDSVDAAETQFRVAEANHSSALFAQASAGFQLEAAQAALVDDGPAPAKLVEVRSPVKGRVLRVLRQSEGPVAAGEPLVEVGDPAALEIVADLLSRDAVKVTPGMKARLERWGGQGTLDAVVRMVEPAGFTKLSALGVEEQRVNVVLDFAGATPGPAALGDGYRVEVRVILEESINVLKVPAGAVFTVKEGSALFVLSGGVASRVVVKTGRRNGLEVEILEGLSEGTLVILHPPDTVEDGKAVIAR
ncbi:MAG: HlyD family efflux transporter periplasmic adaptor subunit [Planctomycetes bacterium]|nr:HlyD family efflux transporter periplasmic adaptor subunit [Planctomycetota bacterium]